MNSGFIFPLGQLPLWLALAALALTAFGMALRVLEKRRRERLHRFAEASLAARLLVGYDPGVRRPLLWLPLLGCAFLALALAQPHWGQAWQDFRRVSRDVVICLDVSESMRAQNPLPNRLERAKQKIATLMERSPGDRFALVAFAGAAELQCPLTLDHGYFKAVLSAVDTDTISLRGTDIAAVLREAAKVVTSEEAAAGSKDTRAVVLISDGEQVSGDAVAEAEKTADAARIFVIGVGDPEGAEVKLPEWVSRYGGSGAGGDAAKPHISKLDEDTLMKIATAGAGAYMRSSVDDWDIMQIHDRLDRLSARNVASDVRMRLVNRYQWPLALAVLCFAAEGMWIVLMPQLRRRRMTGARDARAAQDAVSAGEKSHA